MASGSEAQALEAGPLRLSEPRTLKNSILLLLFLILSSTGNFLIVLCFLA